MKFLQNLKVCVECMPWLEFWEHQQKCFEKMPGRFPCRKNDEKISVLKNVRLSHRTVGSEISSKFEMVVLNAWHGGIFGDINKRKFRILKKVAES